jgi:hypothetical protein
MVMLRVWLCSLGLRLKRKQVDFGCPEFGEIRIGVRGSFGVSPVVRARRAVRKCVRSPEEYAESPAIRCYANIMIVRAYCVAAAKLIEIKPFTR